MDMTYDTWLHRRTLTYIAASLASYMYGTALVIYFQTEYFYFKDTMHVKYPDLFFGLSYASLCTSGCISALTVSYYADRTRNVRAISFVVSCLCILGNILYTLYFSPYIVLTGQFLAGTIAARSVALVGEVSRVYPKERLTKMISLLMFFTTLGGISGPALTFAFNKVNVHIGEWKLNIGNMPGFYMWCLSATQFFVDLFILKNTSKEYDELPYSEQRENIKTYEQVKDLSEFTERYRTAIKTTLRMRPVIVLYLSILVTCYTRGMTFMLHPIKFHEILDWTQTNLAKFNLITIVASALPVSVAVTLLTKYVSDFAFLIFSLVILLLVTLTMMLLCNIQAGYNTLRAIAYSNGALIYLTQTPFHVVSRTLLLKAVPVEIRTITDAMRNTLFELSYAIVGASVKLGSDYTTVLLSLFSSLVVLFIIWFLCNRKSYQQCAATRDDENVSDTKKLID